MKVGTVRVHGEEEILSEIMTALIGEKKEVTKTNSYIEFVLTKEEMNDSNNIKGLRLLSDQMGIYGVEYYQGIKFNQTITECYMNFNYDDNFQFVLEYFEKNDIDKEYFSFISTPEYKKAKELKKIATYEKKLNAYKERLMASVA
jgi:hypothetical protein